MSMTESILKGLMRLFAIVTQIHPEEKLQQSRDIIESYLMQLVNPGKVNQYLIMYDFYHSSLREREAKTGEKQMSLFSVKAIIICEQINLTLDKKQKLLVLMQLLEILNIKEVVQDEDIDFVRTIAIAFKFDEKVFQSCKSFVLDTLYDIPQKKNILVIDNKDEIEYPGIKHVHKEYLKGKIIILSIEMANAYLFRNSGKGDRIYYQGKEILPNKTYYLEKGSAIKSPLIGTIYYSDIVKEFLKADAESNISLAVENLEFRFANSESGIEAFTLYEESGMLVGVMGGSGVGKSTLLNLLNGNLKPKSGRVLINGYNVHEEKDKLKGIIGFIPQDDLLIDELTVFQNLYYNAQLCFKNLDKEQIIHRVNKVLIDLDLFDIRNMKVGSPLNKFISGGQRKRLNIALELIREPFVLFVDEPTSGLSSSDSDVVIDLLKQQSLKGKLVVINIHQPSSGIYKRFDKLVVLDKGGKVVFHGNPLDALVYFKSENQLINAEDGECPTCGNVNPEQVLQILESKKVNEFGELIDERQVTSDAWYVGFKKNLEQEINLGAEIKSDLPGNDFQVPDRGKQFKIFSLRNVLSKLSNTQYLLINLLEAPLLAFILGWFTKYNAGTRENPDMYIFGENVNLPIYLFMSVVVALFLGLMVSAEEIINDRKILKRESFLNLSRFSYYNSKLILLIVLSAIQSFLFVWVGNSILQIEGMFFYFWIMLFMTSVLSNLIGLNISSALKSVVAIYILIPLLLVPQILLGGAMIRFEKLNSKLTNPNYVPVVGDLMPSRWAYEGLSVNQFKNNDYEKNLFIVEQRASDAAFKLNYLLPELVLKLNIAERDIKLNKNFHQTINNLEIIKNEIIKIDNQVTDLDIGFIHRLNINDFNIATANKTRKFIEHARKIFARQLDLSIDEKDAYLLELRNQLGGNDNLLDFKQKFHNTKLEEIMLNKRETLKIAEFNGQLIRKDEPVFILPHMKLGRAHLFSPEKRFFNVYIDTYWFNVLIIFFMALFFYCLLLLEVLKKGIQLFDAYRINTVIKNLKTYLQSNINPILQNKESH